MTELEFITFIRSLLNEPDERFWTDEEIALYKKISLIEIVNLFWQLLYPIYNKFSLLSVVINDRVISLPADCQKVIRIELVLDGTPLPYVPENVVSHYTALPDGEPKGWKFNDKKIYLFPKPTESLTEYLRIVYLPKFTTLAQLPEELHPLLAVMTIINGKAKDEDIPAFLERLYMKFYQSALNFLGTSQVQGFEFIEDPEIYGEESYV